ncbi:MAG: Zn-dependent hydrolase [Haloferacaceae archaeon]
MHVDGDRLRTDIERTGEFGRIDAEEGWGRTVLAGSEADRRAREYLVERMEAAGMTVRVDPVGNVAGRWTPASADPDAAPVAVGSHIDSVPEGGIFDGPLGVYAGVEAVRAIRESDREPARPVEVVSFTEEEGGRTDVGLLGSSVAAGQRSVEEAHGLTDDEGTTLREHLDRIGFVGDATVDPAEWDAWFELHVEQGTRLEEAGVPVGVVTAITGVTNCEVRIRGETDHAGSTPMDTRSDALAAASEFVLDVEAAAREVTLTDSHSAVGTVGKIAVEPNARNVVPGEVRMRTDFRDVEAASMDAVVDRARKSLARLERDRGVETDLDRYRDQPPTAMSDRARAALHAGAERAGVEAMDMHSGAAHDTINVAAGTDTALLFAPSRDGVSHTPREWTDWADCAAATRVLAEGVADLAAE